MQLRKLSSPEEIVTEQGCRRPGSSPLPQLRPQAPFCRGLCSAGAGDTTRPPPAHLSVLATRKGAKRVRATPAKEVSARGAPHYLTTSKPPPRGSGTCRWETLAIICSLTLPFLMTALMTLNCWCGCGQTHSSRDWQLRTFSSPASSHLTLCATLTLWRPAELVGLTAPSSGLEMGLL